MSATSLQPLLDERARPPRPPALEIAISHALLLRVGRGELAPLLRLYRPAPTLAFGRLDRLRDGFEEALHQARRHGFEPVMRLAGGRAAAYHRGSLVCDRIDAAAERFAGVEERYRAFSAQLRDALAALGADAAIGELPREYCAGRHSVHVGNRLKVAGLAQRAIGGSALLSASIVVRDGAPLRRVLPPVYAALGTELDPASAGALEEELPGVTEDAVATELLDRLRGDAILAPAPLDRATLELAAELLPRHALSA